MARYSEAQELETAADCLSYTEETLHFITLAGGGHLGFIINIPAPVRSFHLCSELIQLLIPALGDNQVQC